ncbi:repeat-containing protein [Musa troglodytarum]|uniref:Repeat-containing protein n=1 Tax=Musa troglodytarum TaxID=320322 RepID=A0A9E7H8H5_9LILI|nr:repeat-containing protein [Musa troglodytarum]
MATPNLFSFNTMLAGYARLGMLHQARRLFDRMPHRDVVSWNTMILASLALPLAATPSASIPSSAASHSGSTPTLSPASWSPASGSGRRTSSARSTPRKLFDEMPTRDVLAWTTLVHGLASSGDLVSARRVFDEMPEKNSISWTALIGSYTRHGHPFEALDLFRNMMKLGVAPDQFTFSSALCACGAIASVKHGKQIHARLLRTRFNPNAIVISSLVDMYSKCGDLAGGQRVFDLTDAGRLDAVLWNTMMSAAGQHGDGIEAVKMFEEMIKTGTKPDANTFIVLLTACSHSGLVEQGLQFFCSMRKQHGVVPDEDHYVCLVDLLGRAGRLEEATECLREMPCGPSARAWNALLGVCRIHGNLQLGRTVAQRAIKLDPECPTAYVLLSNFYADLGRWESVEKVRHLMQENKAMKERASSWIAVDNEIQSLGALDQLQPAEEVVCVGNISLSDEA